MASLNDSSRRRRVTFNQLLALWEFLNSHKELAMGYNKSAQAREHSRRMWESVAEALNSQGEGAVKDWKGWSSYWVDYKAKIKKRAAAVRGSLSRTGGGPSDVPPLNELEQKFLAILGDGFGTGLATAQVDPFPTLQQDFDGGDSVAEVAPPSGNIVDLNIEEPPPIVEEMPQPQTQQVDLRHPQPSTSHQGDASDTPGPVRRRRRREGFVSQQSARQTLIELGRRRVVLDERRNEILEEMLNTFKLIASSPGRR